jgi:hypothetical protein
MGWHRPGHYHAAFLQFLGPVPDQDQAGPAASLSERCDISRKTGVIMVAGYAKAMIMAAR